MCRKKVKTTIDKLKCTKAAGVDGTNVEMLKYGGKTAVEWMCDV